MHTGRHLFALRERGFTASSEILSEGEVNHHLRLYRLTADGSMLWAKEGDAPKAV